MATAEPTYSERLRSALERDGWSQLRLVRELAARTGNAVDSERSAVRGYLRGNMPRPERARMIAEITGLPDLAKVEDPRRSTAARLDDHLESLAVLLGDILGNQKSIFRTQKKGVAELEALHDEVRALREALESLEQVVRNGSTQTHSGQA